MFCDIDNIYPNQIIPFPPYINSDITFPPHMQQCTFTQSKIISQVTFTNRRYTITELDPKLWNVSQKQQRAHEDRYQAKRINILYNNNITTTLRYFAVFDGHGGSGKMGPTHVADHCVNYLHIELAQGLVNLDFNDHQLVAHSVRQIFVDFDIKLKINKEYGTTCTAIIIDENRRMIYQINLGDSRSIIFDANNIFSVTEDHDPKIPSERSRIEAAHGTIYAGRVNGMLMVSRAFGDFDFKTNSAMEYDPINGKVSAVPDVKIISVESPINIILTSDAPYERNAFNDESLVTLFRSIPNNHNISQAMVATIAPKTTDDTTIMVVSV